MTLAFPVSIAALSLYQAALMALPRPRPGRRWMPESPWWALAPVGSMVAIIFGIEALPGSAEAVTWLALVAVPPLAALALAWLLPGSRAAWALAVAPLFALAWAAQGALAGEAAAALLSGFAAVALGWLLICVVPARWLRLGIYLMAIVDAGLVFGELLQGPNSVLVAAAPGDLPRLQALEFGAARMGFGDALLAATAGCLLALEGRRSQLLGAVLLAVLALTYDLLFFALDTLPATIPVAVVLAVAGLRSRPRAE